MSFAHMCLSGIQICVRATIHNFPTKGPRGNYDGCSADATLDEAGMQI